MQQYFNSCDAYYSFNNNEERNFDIAWKGFATNRKRRSLSDDDFKDIYSDLANKTLSTADDNDNAIHFGTASYSINSGQRRSDFEDAEQTIESHFDENRLFNNGHDEMDLDNGSNSDAQRSNRQLSIEQIQFTIGADESRDPDKPIFRSAENPEDGMDYMSNGNNTKAFQVLKRVRRGLKFKIKRKTIKSTSAISHTNEINIDSEYLLPDGRVRPNKDHWKYNDMSSLRGFPYYGKFATYSGGGYVASLATDIDFARAVATALEQDAWIDTLTRAVFFEFSVYNANLNFFATGFIVVELLPTGAVMPSASIRVFKLYRYVGAFGRLVMASEIILVICLFFFIYKECRHMYRAGCVYFKSFWSWVEITVAIALFAAIILRGFSWFEGDKNLTQLRKDPEKFISFHYAVVADEALLIAVTVICFASTLKLMKLIAIFPTIVVLKETIFRFTKPLLNYVLPFAIAFSGFAALGYLLFHNEFLFSTYENALTTQMLMLIGGSIYHALQNAHATLGPLFFLFFAAFETFIMLNIFMTIINDSIAESANWKIEARSNDFVDFIEERFRAIFHLRPRKKKRNSSYKRKSGMRERSQTGNLANKKKLNGNAEDETELYKIERVGDVTGSIPLVLQKQLELCKTTKETVDQNKRCGPYLKDGPPGVVQSSRGRNNSANVMLESSYGKGNRVISNNKQTVRNKSDSTKGTEGIRQKTAKEDTKSAVKTKQVLIKEADITNDGSKNVGHTSRHARYIRRVKRMIESELADRKLVLQVEDCDEAVKKLEIWIERSAKEDIRDYKQDLKVVKRLNEKVTGTLNQNCDLVERVRHEQLVCLKRTFLLSSGPHLIAWVPNL